MVDQKSTGFTLARVRRETSMKTLINVVFVCFLALGLVGCGDSSDTPSEPASLLRSAAESASMTESDAQQTKEGMLSLTVDGQEKTFTYFPEDRNGAMSMSTMIVARPSETAAEEFVITVMNFDLPEAELPISLELGLREAMQSDDPSQFVSTPKPLISYISPEGVDFGSYAMVTFDSYEDGVAVGRVEDMELQTRDGATVTLSDVRFEVAL
jgi:hypothetical protein